MSTKFEILIMIMKIILTKKVSYCSHYFSFGQHYSCNLTDRQAFFIMEASTDQKNFHVIMPKVGRFSGSLLRSYQCVWSVGTWFSTYPRLAAQFWVGLFGSICRSGSDLNNLAISSNVLIDLHNNTDTLFRF